MRFLIFILMLISCYSIFSKPRQFTNGTNSIEKNYRTISELIHRSVINDTAYFQKLSHFCDKFGHRFSGSKSLERSIDWIIEKMKFEKLENVRGENVSIPNWVRGNESLLLIEPRIKRLPILGLGGSVPTPSEGIRAEVIVVQSFKDLQAKHELAKGKIVLFNFEFTTYGETMPYRTKGAIEAAKFGAVASLVRSVTPNSLQTPHTGNMFYEENIPKIPHAAISTEDAMLLERMQARGEKILLELKMESAEFPNAISRNIVAELKGWEKPEEIVLLSGHIDSWDVGQGAMDDAGGSIAAWSALHIIKRLGLRPRRTIRVVLFTNEENGGAGGIEYARLHKDEIQNHVLAIESDNGVFKPSGFGFSGNGNALVAMKAIGRLLEPLEAGTITSNNGGIADITPLVQAGVLGAGLHVNMSKYFWYHHTEADTIDKLDNKEFNLCVGAMAILAYIVADMPERLN